MVADLEMKRRTSTKSASADRFRHPRSKSASTREVRQRSPELRRPRQSWRLKWASLIAPIVMHVHCVHAQHQEKVLTFSGAGKTEVYRDGCIIIPVATIGCGGRGLKRCD